MSPKLRVLGALRHRDFCWLWAANLVQAAGTGMQFLVLGWLVLELTDSSSQLGLVIFLYGVPNLALLIFGGTFADRIDRRWLLLSTLVVVATVHLVIGTVTTAGLAEMWHIYVTVIILGMMQGLNMPARLAMVSDLVNREDIMNAVALNSTVTHAGRIVGAAVAGGIIELADIGTALYINSGCYLAGIAFLLGIQRLPPLRQARATTVVRDLLEGFRYFWKTPVPFSMIGMGLAFGFFAGAYIQVLPAFAKEVLGVGVGGAGTLIAGAALGSLAGSFALVFLGDFHHKNRLLLGSILTFGLTLILFAWTPWFWVAWAILLLVGMGSMSYISIGTTVLQLTVPPNMHGRILSMWALGSALHYMGALPMGVAADALSWPVSITGGAVLLLLVVLWLGIWRPALRNLRI